MGHSLTHDIITSHTPLYFLLSVLKNFPRYCPYNFGQKYMDFTDIVDLCILILLSKAAVLMSFSSGFKLFKSQKILTSKRFEPSSRNFLIGEQPNPWELLHPQDKLSRHRGAEQSRRYGLSGSTSLLSPE